MTWWIDVFLMIVLLIEAFKDITILGVDVQIDFLEETNQENFSLVVSPSYGTLEGNFFSTGLSMCTSQLTLILIFNSYWLLRKVLSNTVSIFWRKFMA